ncbi:MAG: hypothetical protein VB021_00085 [Oscillospiraceae bacterium]|nr:hypothetical protein [Oscillospiraceae bacterium]
MNETEALLDSLVRRADERPETALRLAGWERVIEWDIDGESFFWSSAGGRLSPCARARADIVFRCTAASLRSIAAGERAFFIALWVTGELRFEGLFGDAYRLGYVFLQDRRRRRVLFVSHCWLDLNTIFPEGAAFAGANEPVVEALLGCGVGIEQMPCPEYRCLGLEKHDYGAVSGDALRAGFRDIAAGVVRDIKNFRALGVEIVGVMGMNPSPSCGVGRTKGKGTMLGTDRDTAERDGDGLFIEELRKLLDAAGLGDVPVFGIRRFLPGEPDYAQRLEALRNYAKEKS